MSLPDRLSNDVNLQTLLLRTYPATRHMLNKMGLDLFVNKYIFGFLCLRLQLMTFYFTHTGRVYIYYKQSTDSSIFTYILMAMNSGRSDYFEFSNT